MADEPVVEPAAAAPTPEPAPAATDPAPAAAPAPEAAPVAAPDSTPAATKPGEYPVESPPTAANVARSTFRGQGFDMTQAQLDELVHQGLSAIEVAQRGQPAAQAPAQAAPTVEEPDEMAQLKQEMVGLKQSIQAQSYETRVQNETTRINQSLDAEVGRHEVFKDNKDLAELGRKSALALLNHNPRMTEADAMKSVANDFGKALNAKKEQWIKGKVDDASGAELPPGGAASGSPTPPKMTGKDLRLGRVADAAMKRTGAERLIT